MKRLIVKIGSAVLLDENGHLSEKMLRIISVDIAEAKKKGYEIVLVTSGAVASGTSLLGCKASKGTRAAVGQPLLMRKYETLFGELAIPVAQYLITREDFSDRKRYICLQSSLEEAFHFGVLPIINDNDVLHEARESFSDNDQLACYLGIMMQAEAIVILTSVDGIYRDFGTRNQCLLEDIFEDSTFDTIDTKGKTSVGTGGMEAKMKSVRVAMSCGVDTYLVKGKQEHPLLNVLNNIRPFTHVHGISASSGTKGIKKWLLAGASPKGSVIISEQGAVSVCNRMERRSVLAKGVLSVEGYFEKGEVISMYDEQGHLLAYGVSRISSDELNEKKGQNNIVVVHADYLLVMNG